MNRENSEELEVLRTFGNSMLGVFSPGDKIFARKIDFSTPQAGDIIVFTQNNRKQRLVVHRIIKRSEDRILTHGDNNLLPDRPITRKNGDIYLVEKALRNGEPVYFSHGAQGMQDFYQHQRKKKLVQKLRQIIRRAFSCAPLRLFAPSVKLLEYKEFRRQGIRFKAMLFYKNRPVAVFDFKRRCWRINNWWLLFYTPEMLAHIIPE